MFYFVDINIALTWAEEFELYIAIHVMKNWLCMKTFIIVGFTPELIVFTDFAVIYINKIEYKSALVVTLCD